MLYSRQRFKYGYFEIRFKLPAPPPDTAYNHEGFGPNLWLYAARPDSGIWWSEIDVFEVSAFNRASGDTSKLTTTIHYSNKDSTWHPKAFSNVGNVSNSTWHVSAAWWTPEFIKIYFNGDEVLSITGNDPLPVDSLIEMPLIIDINSPASNYCLNFDSTRTFFPYVYEIDYIRVYQV